LLSDRALIVILRRKWLAGVHEQEEEEMLQAEIQAIPRAAKSGS